jgi:hypothetical protein
MRLNFIYKPPPPSMREHLLATQASVEAPPRSEGNGPSGEVARPKVEQS